MFDEFSEDERKREYGMNKNLEEISPIRKRKLDKTEKKEKKSKKEIQIVDDENNNNNDHYDQNNEEDIGENKRNNESMKELPKPPEESFLMDKQWDFDSQNENNEGRFGDDDDSIEKGLRTPKKTKLDLNDSVEELSSAKMKRTNHLNNNGHHRTPNLFERSKINFLNEDNYENGNGGYNGMINNHDRQNNHNNDLFSINSNLYLDNKDFSFNISGESQHHHQNHNEKQTISRYTNDLEEMKKIGQTNTSSVYLVKAKKDGCNYAVKILDKNKENNNEIHILSRLKNTKYLLRYYCCWEEQNHLYIQTEYCEMGSLRKMFKAKHFLTLNELLKMMRHVTKGLVHLHKNNLCHRDIKPGNIYLCDGVFKIGDFGITISCELTEYQEDESIDGGDGRYISPEFMDLKVKQLRYHIKKSDIFSLGCSVFELSTKKILNSEINEEIRAYRIKFPQNFETNFSLPFQNLIMDMLKTDPEERPSAEMLIEHD
eukprot:TRINITY_DN17080_c0_g1_i1.p1 TRINITY_DN17080_c0_g1~~TRINITY_DN17080_c0_g1_i1.p1  ORF type:complete len:486 (-),score=133.70 TRINITY_DN17080_c0_g1_i1:80-1537(-)